MIGYYAVIGWVAFWFVFGIVCNKSAKGKGGGNF